MILLHNSSESHQRRNHVHDTLRAFNILLKPKSLMTGELTGKYIYNVIIKSTALQLYNLPLQLYNLQLH